jgi:hypothetical protein
MTPEKMKALDAIEGSLHRMAMKVLETPEFSASNPTHNGTNPFR